MKRHVFGSHVRSVTNSTPVWLMFRTWPSCHQADPPTRYCSGSGNPYRRALAIMSASFHSQNGRSETFHRDSDLRLAAARSNPNGHDSNRSGRPTEWLEGGDA